jgi:hypothetical protein
MPRRVVAANSNDHNLDPEGGEKARDSYDDRHIGRRVRSLFSILEGI